MKTRQAASTQAVYAKVDELVETHEYHEMTLATLKRWIVDHRWQLVDILTQGEYARLLAQPRLPEILDPGHVTDKR
jgi:hypothetical protein